MIRVLVVEDSPVVQSFLKYVLNSDPALRVVGTAGSGEEAVQTVARLKPDIVTMDVNMPGMDGFEATRRIMESHPTPIVIVSGELDVRQVATSFRAMEVGALAAVPRPRGLGHPDYARTARELTRTVRLMSEVKVVRRWSRKVSPASTAPPATLEGRREAGIRVVAMGASTGGPMALRTILASLPGTFRCPILIVQHIALGFVQGFVEWLGQSSGFSVRVAGHGDLPAPGCAYVAPDDAHMGVDPACRIVLSRDPPEGGLRPAIGHLFRSVAEVCGPRAAGVLLTGMGVDGARQLKSLRDRGAVTIAQDAESCVVSGMPAEAVRLNGASLVLSPERVAKVLVDLSEGGPTGPMEE